MTVGEGVGRGVGARYTMMVYSPVEQLAADRVRGRDDRLKLWEGTQATNPQGHKETG
jgi:hypothetical protein